MSWKDQSRRRRQAQRRGHRGARRAAAETLRRLVGAPVFIGVDLSSQSDACVIAGWVDGKLVIVRDDEQGD